MHRAKSPRPLLPNSASPRQSRPRTPRPLVDPPARRPKKPRPLEDAPPKELPRPRHKSPRPLVDAATPGRSGPTETNGGATVVAPRHHGPPIARDRYEASAVRRMDESQRRGLIGALAKLVIADAERRQEDNA